MTTPKFTGRDCELSTAGIDAAGRSLRAFDAAEAILAEIGAAFEPLGTSPWPRGPARSAPRSRYRTESERRWGPGGDCYYVDMGHLEVCTAEALEPRRLAAQLFACLRVAEAARSRAEATGSVRYELTTANVDAADPGVSWGTHTNFSVSRELWENLCLDPRRPAVHGFVTSAIAAAVPFFGAGYVLPMRDGSAVFSLSARAHHLTRTCTEGTTVPFERGLLNARREPHGKGSERLHLIGFDCNPIGAALSTSFLQCVLAAAEEGFGDLVLSEPLRALREWSWRMDLERGTLPAKALLADGSTKTLPEYVRELTARLLGMCEAGLIGPDVAPEARELLPIVHELCERAIRGDLVGCARHLDWAAKLLVLTDLANEPGRRLGDAESRLGDHEFGNTNPEVGALWPLWAEGHVDPLIRPEDVDACLRDGPANTRAWARGRLVQEFSDSITDLDWSRVELRRSHDPWQARAVVELPSIANAGEASFGPILAAARSVDDLVARLRGAAPGIRTAAPDPLFDIRPRLALPDAGGSSQDSNN